MRNELMRLLFVMVILAACASNFATAQEIVQSAGTSIESLEERVLPVQTLSTGQGNDTSSHRSNTSASKWSPERNPAVSTGNDSGEASSDITSRIPSAKSAIALHPANSACAQNESSSPFKHSPFGTRPATFSSGEAIPTYSVHAHEAERKKLKQSKS